MSEASYATAVSQLGRTHDIIERTIGRAPFAFRPPYGRLSGALSMVAASMGYDILFWSDVLEATETAATNLAHLDQKLGAGSIVLSHDGDRLPGKPTADTLPRLIHRMHERGIKLVTMPELLEAALREHMHKYARNDDTDGPIDTTKTSG